VEQRGPLTSLDWQDIIQLHNDGHSQAKIAEWYGVQRRKIQELLNAPNPPIPSNYTPMSPAPAEMVQAYTDGTSIGTIAKATPGMSARRVSIMLINAGFTSAMSKQNPPPLAPATPKMVREYEAGQTIRSMAEAHHLSYGSMRRRLEYAGVTFRRRGRPRLTRLE
jgi:hypothetical protein